MTPRLLFLVRALLVALLVIGAPRSAGADERPPEDDLNAEARERYRLGSEALAAQRYVEAALHFETASSKNPHAVAWYMAAEAWERASRPERAADALARALEVPGLSADLAAKVKPRLALLERTMGTLVLGGASSYRAALDGGALVAPPARLHGLPGTHTLNVVPPDKERFRREVVLTAGGEVTFALGEEEDDRGAPTLPPPTTIERVVEREVPTPGEPRRYVGFMVTGLGVASVVGGLLLGASALDARDAYKTSRTQDAYDHVRSVQAWSNVTLAVGGVLTAAGLALILWPSERDPKQATSLRVTPGGASLGGTF